MMKITNEYLKEELEDIINCIVNFDHTETLEVKGRYFDIIQKDLKKLVKNNGVLDGVSQQRELLLDFLDKIGRHDYETKPFKQIVDEYLKSNNCG